MDHKSLPTDSSDNTQPADMRSGINLAALVRLPPIPGDHPELRRSLIAVAPLVARLEDAPRQLVQQLEKQTAAGSGASPDHLTSTKPQLSPGQHRTLRGWITDYPVYSALWYQPPDLDSEGIVRCMQAVLLAASWVQPGAGQAEYSSTLREAGLCVRRVSLNRALRDYAQHAISLPAKSMRQVKTEIQRYLKRIAKTQQETLRLLEGFARLISYAQQEKRPPKRGEQVAGARHQRTVPEEDELDASFESIETIPNSVLDRSVVALYSEAAAAPVRESPARQHIAVSLDSTRVYSARSRILQAKDRARAMATSAQRLIFASDHLQPLDVESLLTWLRENEDNEKEELASLLFVTMFLTGSDVARASQIQIAAHPPSNRVDDAVHLVLDPLSWYVPIPKLKDAYVPAPHLKDLFREVTPWLVLPIPKSFPGVQLLIKEASRLAGKNLFEATEQRLTGAASRVVASINKNTGARLTISRVAKFLDYLISDATGDEADGSFFSSLKDETGFDARLYYYSPSSAYLVNAYMTAWEKITASSTLKWEWQPTLVSNGPEYVGSAGCPSDEALPPAITVLQKRVFQLSRGRRSLQRSVELHNQLTTYVTIFGMWAAALRAVRDPIEVELIDPIDGFLGISEKDTDEYSMSRVAPLVPSILQQLKHYAHHRARFLEAVAEFNFPITPETWLFYVERKKPRRKRIQDQRRNSDTSDSEESTPRRLYAVPVTPGRLGAAIEESYPFPLNAQRHYLRTRLRELGVRGEFVDALMGHGSQGEEPYGRYSAISPKLLKDAVGEPLEKLLRDMGWRAIPGMH